MKKSTPHHCVETKTERHTEREKEREKETFVLTSGDTTEILVFIQKKLLND